MFKVLSRANRNHTRHTKKILTKRGYAVRHKVVSLDDAVAVVNNNDNIAVSGFVAHGCPEALCSALGERFKKTGEPKDLTLIFEGGPGDWDSKGLNHFGHIGMLKRAVGSHYGQIPKVAKLALENQIEAYNFPMGSISRMIRATATKGPGHISTIGTGTFVDPRLGGGKLNPKTVEDLVEVITIGGKEYLWYKAIPIQVAFIRATTADPEGNLTFEKESLLGDVRNIAMATKTSGGIVVAQVERIAAHGTLAARSVHVPGVMVDCVYKISPEEKEKHWMSFMTNYDPAWSQTIRVPLDALPTLPMDERKIIARRAAQSLTQNSVVNLGIGMPEGVANIANEEKIVQYITLTTEPGVIGGVGASGHNFGPAANAEAIMEMNQQFDFYNGGGLDSCFLGMAQISQQGDVNVSRLSKTHLTGPGGFVDITQSTQRVTFMGTFTAKNLEIAVKDGKLQIIKEGQVKKFVNNLLEVTFSGSEATKRGQNVTYVTERCVFKHTTKGIELIEVAPGIDIEKNILPYMEYKPIINKPTTMDPRIFSTDIMNLRDKLFGMKVPDRVTYYPANNYLYLMLNGLVMNTKHDVDDFFSQYESFLKKYCIESDKNGFGGKLHVVVNYDAFDCREDCLDGWAEHSKRVQSLYYQSVKRYTGTAFGRHRLGLTLAIKDENKLWSLIDKSNCGTISSTCLRQSLKDLFDINISQEVLAEIMSHANPQGLLEKKNFPHVVSLLSAAGYTFPTK